MQLEKITLFVDSIAIFIRVAGFEIYGTIANLANGRAQIVVAVRHRRWPELTPLGGRLFAG
jgi:hypothetical protein